MGVLGAERFSHFSKKRILSLVHTYREGAASLQHRSPEMTHLAAHATPA
jgi:hypothetical protein